MSQAWGLAQPSTHLAFDPFYRCIGLRATRIQYRNTSAQQSSGLYPACLDRESYNSLYACDWVVQIDCVPEFPKYTIHACICDEDIYIC